MVTNACSDSFSIHAKNDYKIGETIFDYHKGELYKIQIDFQKKTFSKFVMKGKSLEKFLWSPPVLTAA